MRLQLNDMAASLAALVIHAFYGSTHRKNDDDVGTEPINNRPRTDECLRAHYSAVYKDSAVLSQVRISTEVYSLLCPRQCGNFTTQYG